MFERAVAEAMTYTMPVAGLRRRREDQVVFSTLGAFIVVNSDGWVLTAAHIVHELVQASKSVASDGELSDSADLWALPGFDKLQPRLVTAHVDELADIALVRLEPFEPEAIQGLPRFRPAEKPVAVGEAVCRLGFPFHGIAAEYREADKRFDVRGGFPVPAFALDGMISRFEERTHANRRVKSLQTSTPGLRGQSGGPLFDVDGCVVGLQSRTVHLDLGFDAAYERDGEKVIERQFINVGVAADVSELCRLMDAHEVTYQR